MRRKNWPLFLAVSLLVCFTSVAQCGANVSSRDMERLLDAIAQIESNNRSKAVGDSGRAIGAYQIHKAYWKDGTRFLGVKWSYKEAFDTNKARRVVRAYLRHYGRGRSLIQMAMCSSTSTNEGACWRSSFCRPLRSSHRAPQPTFRRFSQTFGPKPHRSILSAA